MASQNHETTNGWPLGLQTMSMKLKIPSHFSTPPLELQPQPHSSNSDLSSSNLDTQSSASFFQDTSVSLGKLIGFGQQLYFQNTIPAAEQNNWQPAAVSSGCDDVSNGDLCRLGICIPVIAGSLVKITRNRSKSK